MIENGTEQTAISNDDISKTDSIDNDSKNTEVSVDTDNSATVKTIDDLNHDDLIELMKKHQAESSVDKKNVTEANDNNNSVETNNNNDSEDKTPSDKETDRKPINIDPELLKQDPRLNAFKELYDIGLEKEEAMALAFKEHPDLKLEPKFQLTQEKLEICHRLAVNPNDDDLSVYALNKLGFNLNQYFEETLGGDERTQNLLKFVLKNICQNEHQLVLNAFQQEQQSISEVRAKEEQLQNTLINNLYTELPALSTVDQDIQQIVISKIIQDFGEKLKPIQNVIFSKPELVEKIFMKVLKNSGKKFEALLGGMQAQSKEAIDKKNEVLNQRKLNDIQKLNNQSQPGNFDNGKSKLSPSVIAKKLENVRGDDYASMAAILKGIV